MYKTYVPPCYFRLNRGIGGFCPEVISEFGSVLVSSLKCSLCTESVILTCYVDLAWGTSSLSFASMHAFSRTTFRSRNIQILTKTLPVPSLSSLPLRLPLASTLQNPFLRPLICPSRQSRHIHIVIPPPPPPPRFPRQHRYQRFQSRTSSLRDLWHNSPQFRLLIFTTSAGLLTVYVYNIEEVPVSGRKRFNIISPALETQLGKSTYQVTLKEFGPRILPRNHPASRMVSRVMERLIKVSGK